MSDKINFAGRVWPTTGRGIEAANLRPPDYVGLIEEVPGIVEYRWFLERPGQESVKFFDLDNAHAYITGYRVILDFIEPFLS